MKAKSLVFIILSSLCSLLYAQGEADNSSSLTRQGIMKVRGGYCDEAIKLFDRAIGMDKENVLAYYQRGKAKAGLGNYKEAIADFDKTIQLEPTYAPAYMDRGEAKKKLGDGASAKKDFDKALELDSSYKESGEIKVSEKPAKNAEQPKSEEPSKEKAIDEFHKQLDRWQSKMDEYMANILSKEDLTADRYIERAKGKINLGDYDGAIKDFDQAIKLNPNLSEAYLWRGAAKSSKYEYVYAGMLSDKEIADFKSALNDFDMAIGINPKCVIAFSNKGSVRVQLGDYKGAIMDFDKVIEINPNFFWGYYSRGSVKEKLNNYNDAIKDFDKAISIYTSSADNMGFTFKNFENVYLSRGLAKLVCCNTNF